MNEDFNKQIEAQITRELRALGELPAPAGLASRILRRIGQPEWRPWYHRAWHTWPLAGQIAGLAMLLGLFAGLAYGSWHLRQGEEFASVSSQLTATVADLGLIWKTLDVLGTALIEVVRSLNPILLSAAVMVMFLSYAACAALGTACVRFALVRR